MAARPPRTVAFVLPTLNRGGAELQSIELARHLGPLGWRVVFVPLEEGGALVEEVRRGGFDVFCPDARLWLPKWSPRFWWNFAGSVLRVAGVLRRERVSVVVSFLFWSNAHAVLGGMLAGVRGIATCRRAMGAFRDGRAHYGVIERLLNLRVDAIIANSRAVARDTLRREGCAPGKLRVVHNSIDAARFFQAVPDAGLQGDAALRGGTCTVAMVANLKPVKRHAVFLRGFAAAAAEFPGLRAVLVGEDHGERGRLERLAAELGVVDRVVFAGGRADAAPVYALADVVALTSDAEGFPNAVLEGMAAGRPVVATRVGGVPELVVDGVNGLLVRRGDAEGFGRALGRLAADPALRGAMGAESLRRANDPRFSPDGVAMRYARLLEGLAAGGSGAKGGGGLRVLFVIGSMREGGAEGQLVVLMRGLRALGFEPGVMLLRREGVRLQELEREGFPVFDAGVPRFRPRWSPVPWLRLAGSLLGSVRAVRGFRPDVVHAWLFWAHLWAGLLGALGAFRVPLVTSRRQLPVFKAGSRWMHWAENRVNGRARAIVCNSRGVLEETRRAERNTRGRLLLVYGGIDPVVWEGAAAMDLGREFAGLAGASVVVLCVASYVRCKGHGDLLRAWERVVREHRGARLLCVGGDGGELGGLRRLAVELGIAGSVVLSGPRRDIPSLTKGADIAVLASHEEGFSNVILEAMACGKPVVATAVGGNCESVVDGVTGYLVPAGDAGALAAGIGRLIGSEELRRQLGEAGRQRVREEFPQSRMIARHAALYRRLVS